MPIGAASVTGRFSHDSRPGMMALIQFPGDNAYQTGGSPNFRSYVRQAIARGGLDIIAVFAHGVGAYSVAYNRDTDRLIVYTAAGTEVANGTDLSATLFKVLVISC